MITLQTRLPFWADNIFQLPGKPVCCDGKKIGKITGVTFPSDGMPLIHFSIYKKYYNLIKDALL